MHPLEVSLQTVRAANPYFKIMRTAAPQGSTVAAWCATDAPVWQQRLAKQRAALPTAALSTLTSGLLQAYCWPLLSGPIACAVLTQRVPDISPTVCAIADEHDIPAVLELGSDRFFCLASDASASHPDAQIVDTMAELHAALRQQIVGHCTPVVEFLAAASGLSAASLWLLVADAAAGIVVRVHDMRQTTSTSAMQADAEALCNAAESPLTLPSVAVSCAALPSGDRVMYRRLSCCFWHKRPNGGVCVNCPRRSHADQDAAISAYYTALAGQS